MAAIPISLFVFLFLSLFYTAEAQQRYSNITLGSSLTPTSTTNSSWWSPSGLYAFGFYQQDNGYYVGVFLAGIPEKTVVWTANRDDPPVPSNATLAFTDGMLVLQQPPGPNTNIADLPQPASAASMLDSGNFVLYNSNQEIIWQSFDHPTDTIVPGQRLTAGKELFSGASETDPSTGIFRLKMQNDGNLVQYPVQTPDTAPYAYWVSWTDGEGDNVTLNLDDDGHLYLLNNTGANIHNLTEGESTREVKIYRMKIDVDGIFRVYSRTLDQTGNWSTKWRSTGDKCDPKGLCGVNAFCVQMDTEVDCRCLPGFEFANHGKLASGCQRNLVADSCNNTNGVVKFTMSALENTIWEDTSYFVLELSTKEDCEDNCLQDCNCEAVLFEDGRCKKQKLPLRYGRRLQTDSQFAFIKIGNLNGPITKALPFDPPKKEVRVEILIIGVSLVGFAFLLLALSGVLIYRNRVWTYRKIVAKGNVEFDEDVALRCFTFAELEQVTNGFNQELGRGAFGTVYKGVIPYNQKFVAVKKLEKQLTEGEREFQTEIKVIGRNHHRNLVRLIGYCLDGPNRLLVYEYMRNGTLADFLFTSERRASWDERIRIALDIARGILYLHEDDFGLAKLLKPDQTKTFTAIRGTKGYVAPEWHRKLPVTIKADVYSFGIMLLEIICCRKCLEWSLPEEEADEPSLRPSMKKVVLMMEGTVEIPVPPSPSSFLSAV
ncbi:receptor-like protein kinase 1 [Actinidia rufa]|uniref:Receptor-like serine/threonine-protein kinase n=1 Tax=Actinidia rufa TaxID=165716 RepID=A0A7J0EXX1_9ERIC|nr:receptor-like protein kinase 1 [Actinidia rufa]